MKRNRQAKMLSFGMAAVAVMGLLGTSRAEAQTYHFTSLGLVGSDPDSTGPGINNAASVEVAAQLAAGASGTAAYSVGGSPLTSFGTSSGGDAAGNAVNDGGIAVGFYTVSSNQLGFYSNSTGSTLTALPTFGGSTSVATAINGNSATFSVVGQSQYAGAGGALRAFLWSNSSPSVLTALGTTSADDGLGATGAGATSMAYGINASGLVVGYAQTTSAQHAFVYATGSSKMYDLGVDTSDGSGASTAYAINSSGVIVGQTDTDSSTQAFIYSGYNFAVTGGTSSDTTLGNHFLDIGSLDGTTSSALAINTGGDVVGTSSADAGSASHAFLYEPGGSMQDLNDLTTLPVGWTLDEATGINDAGDITGIADDGTSEYAFLLTPSAVPEPASIGVVCIGGGLLLLKRRRQALS